MWKPQGERRGVSGARGNGQMASRQATSQQVTSRHVPPWKAFMGAIAPSWAGVGRTVRFLTVAGRDLVGECDAGWLVATVVIASGAKQSIPPLALRWIIGRAFVRPVSSSHNDGVT